MSTRARLACPATGRTGLRSRLVPGALVPALLGLLLALVMLFAFDRWVAATSLPPLSLPTSVEVTARDGRLLRAFTVADGRWRLALSQGAVDERYVALLLAYEDRRFYRHAGVDPLALARAVVQSVITGRRVSGGSTLTMQVARLLEDGATGTWRGKLRQVRLALALERVLSKDEILGLYMHMAPMGGNLEGVRAGSLAWFGKEPTRLTEAEAALLVALPQAPAGRTPDVHPEAARAARDRVLARGVASGAISDDAGRAASREALPSVRRPFPVLAPHLADRLTQADPSVQLHHTTIDSDVQLALEALAATALVDLPPQVTVALLVADVHTGEVLASVGSADYTSEARRGYVDMTQALRSPGSTLKPLIYGLAFSSGILHPESLLDDRPEDYGGYAPQNFDGVFRGRVTARRALELSLNLPVVAVTEVLGPARLLAALRQAGVQAVVPGDAPGLAVALGGVGISLEGLVQLYASLANGGEVVELTAGSLSDSEPVGRADGAAA
ncbi:MAG TPA: penicillin-binding protein 1C, partial [Trueperaceae bacterium]|nr:penicillin-binding protein 1C [Trueperaceae bacterium]